MKTQTISHYLGLLIVCALFTEVVYAAPPKAPILRAPAGNITEVATSYQWSMVVGASLYQLSIKDSTGNISNYQYKAEQKCLASKKSCSAYPGLALPPGNSSWRVRAKNQAGWGAWSATKSFTVAPALTYYPNTLEKGDSYNYVTDTSVATDLFNSLWRVLAAQNVACWVSEYSTLTQYQFYQDPSFLPGPLYRFSGYEESVGQLNVYSVGWYYRANSDTPLKAAFVSAGLGDVLLVLTDANTFVEAYWHGNYLVATPYHIGQQCL